MPSKVIIDTDPGVDDVLAILMSLASPELSISLISIVFGNTHAPIAHKNLLKIYHLLAQEVAQVPEAFARYDRLHQDEKTLLACGEDGPIGGDKAVAAYFHGPDGLSNISVTHPHFTPPVLVNGDLHDHLEISPKPAHEVMLDILREEPEGSVTIVALGPLTNLAQALRSDSKTFSRVQKVVWMGGTLEHPGNTSPVAEFNCFADPYAASEILTVVKTGAFELIMAPLDITTPHKVPFSDLIQSDETLSDAGPLKRFVSAMLLRVRGLQASFGLPDSMEMHDPLAVWYAIASAGLGKGQVPPGWTLKARDFQIERKGEFTRGMCIVDRRETGEEGVVRTSDTKLANNAVPGLPPKDETTGRMGEKVVKPPSLPWVITGTPGSEVLRREILGRVFGVEV